MPLEISSTGSPQKNKPSPPSNNPSGAGSIPAPQSQNPKNRKRKMKIKEIKEIIKNNKAEDRFQFEGLTSSEIGTYSRYLMFGDNDEAFPDQETWALIAD